MMEHAINLLKDVKTVMIYSFSSIVYKLLVQAHEQGYRFKVIVVDDPSNKLARISCSKLNEKGIEVIYTLINSVAYFIKGVDKIFVGAYTMFSNGTLMANTGTAIIATCAHQQKIPFYA